MKVEAFLKPHTGIQDTEAGPVEFTHPDQWMVFFKASEDNGEPITPEKFVGYLPKKPGRPFLPITSFVEQPQGLQDLIHEAVNKAVGDQRPLGFLPLHPKMLEKLEAQEDEDGDVDEEDPDDTELEE